MSSKKSKNIQERKTEKDKIFELLVNTLGFSEGKPEEDGRVFFEKTVPGQAQQIIINGQVSTQQEPDRHLKLEYYGEGSVSNPDGTGVMPMWGFALYDDDIPISPVHYVNSLEDFQQTFLG